MDSDRFRYLDASAVRTRRLCSSDERISFFLIGGMDHDNEVNIAATRELTQSARLEHPEDPRRWTGFAAQDEDVSPSLRARAGNLGNLWHVPMQEYTGIDS